MNGVGDGHREEPRTDLDSHANMPAVGSGVHVLVDNNRTCEVSPYSPDYEPMEFHWWMLQCDTTVMGECTF
jgi:hypothetical protein